MKRTPLNRLRERKGASPRLHTTPDRRPAPGRSRGGLTLLEVVLTLAIFVGSMAVLSQLVSTGYRAAQNSRFQTQAIIRAEAQMNEVVANPNLMVSAAGMPFENEYAANARGQWQWSLDVQNWDQNANLLKLELTVTHYSTEGVPNANYTLRRFVRDPQVMAEDAAAAAETEEEALF